MTPLLKNISTTPKRVMLKAEINRAVIRSDGINLKELNKREGRESGKERAKRKSENRKIRCNYVVSRSSGKLERR
jgi:hypothetical protein